MPANKQLKLKRKSTGRPCTICNHARVVEIDKDITQNKSFRNISLRWLGHTKHFVSVFRHATSHLKLDVQTLRSEGRLERAINVYDEFAEQLIFAKKARKAADKWLSDPDNEGEFTIAPRSDEIDVVFFDYLDKDKHHKPKRKTENLQELLARLEGTRYDVAVQFVNTVDLRDYALKTLDKCDMAIDKFAKIGGDYTTPRENPDNIKTSLESFTSWLATNPEADHDEIAEFIERASTKTGVDAKLFREKIDTISKAVN